MIRNVNLQKQTDLEISEGVAEVRLRSFSAQKIVILSLFCLVYILAAGCSHDKSPAPVEPVKAPELNPTEKDTESKASKKAPETDPKASEQEPDTLEISSNVKNEEELSDDEEIREEDKPDNEVQTDYVITQDYQHTKPTLMGCYLYEPLQNVALKFGEPLEQFEMSDDQGTLQVWNYNGFAVGFDANEEVKFIEVSSDAINPGLNGLKIGSTSEAAIELLGMPDVNTTFVLNYFSEQAVLKLDLDPETGVIHSIKLFPNQ